MTSPICPFWLYYNQYFPHEVAGKVLSIRHGRLRCYGDLVNMNLFWFSSVMPYWVSLVTSQLFVVGKGSAVA